VARPGRPALTRGAAAAWRRIWAGAVVAAALAASGCANIPTGGSVQAARAGNGVGQQYPQLLAVGPGSNWSQNQIVLGFLHASASFQNDYHAARLFLTAAQNRQWRPGVAANVMTSQLDFRPPIVIHSANGGPATQEVTVRGQQLVTLTDSGQYRTSSGARSYDFTLEQLAGRWRISKLPFDTSLLLTQPDFVKVYAPHNIYFFAQSGSLLVPNPVFVPQSYANTDVARRLVTALHTDPPGLLSGAVSTRFPRGITSPSVRISGSTAVVDLRGKAAAKASPAVRRDMAAQLVWTLTSNSYGQAPVAQSVQLEINGVVQRFGGRQFQLQQAYTSLLPAAQPSAVLYYLTDHAADTLQTGVSRPVPAFSGRSLRAIAVSPQGTRIAGIAASGRKGCVVYSGPARSKGPLMTHFITSGNCGSLSWDPQGDVWLTTSNYVWLLTPRGQNLIPGQLGENQISDFQVAPDGVRAAMILRTPGGQRQIAIGAISPDNPPGGIEPHTTSAGTGITDPTQVMWYSDDDLLVLGSPGPHASLYEVPVDGGIPTQLQAEPGTVWVTTDGAGLAAGTASGQIYRSSGPNALWMRTSADNGAQYPSYPG
jgi:hypothetical protein